MEKFKKIYNEIFSSPEEVEKKFFNWFDVSKKNAFFTALIVGLITHLIFITELIFSQDGLWNSLNHSLPGMWELSLGRWGIFLAGKIVNYLAIPSITGIISIILIATSTVFIVDVLGIKNKITVFLISSAMVVAPSLTSTMIFAYTSVAYCTAMLLTVLTVWFIFKKHKTILEKIINTFIAIVLFVISFGIYQSYLGVVIGLTAIRLIKDLFDNEISIKSFFVHGLIMVLVVALGGILYYGITQMIWEKTGLNSADYKGMQNISFANTIISLPTSIPDTYKYFNSYFFDDGIVYNKIYSRDVFYKVMFISTIILEMILIFANKIYKKPYKIFIILILNILLPLGFNAILLLTPDTDAYILTVAQLILMIPFAGMIWEIAAKKGTFIFRWASIISVFLIVFTYFLADNVSYHCLKLTYNQAYTTAIRIVDRIEQTQGYTPDRLILINGIIESNMDYRYQKTSNLGDYTVGMFFKECPVFHGTFSGMEGTWTNFFANYMGMKVQFCSSVDYENLLNTPQYQEMGVWPAEDSVQFIGHVIVVKLREEPIMP